MVVSIVNRKTELPREKAARNAFSETYVFIQQILYFKQCEESSIKMKK